MEKAKIKAIQTCQTDFVFNLRDADIPSHMITDDLQKSTLPVQNNIDFEISVHDCLQLVWFLTGKALCCVYTEIKQYHCIR